METINAVINVEYKRSVRDHYVEYQYWNFIYKDRQIHRHTDTQTHRHTDTQTHTQTI